MTEFAAESDPGNSLSGVARVIFTPDINQVDIIGMPLEDDTTEDRTIRLGPGRALRNVPARLAEIYDAVGPGVHDSRDVATVLDVHVNSVQAAARQIVEVLPSLLFDIERLDTATLLHLGAMAIEVADATDDQRAAYGLRVEALKETKMRLAIAEALARDREKIDLGTQDHAIVTARARGDRYYLPLDESSMILAARVIEAVAGLRRNYDNVRVVDVVARLWHLMPTSERQLFTNKEKFIYGDPSTILNKDVYAILEGLTGKMGITRRGKSDDDYVMSGGEVTVEYFDAPLVMEDDQDLILAFPRTSELSLRNIPTKDVAAAAGFVRIATGKVDVGSMSHAEAIDMLAAIVQPSVKRAMLAALRESGSSMPVGKALIRLHELVRLSLGNERYYIAWDGRQIGGSKARRGVKLTGGALLAGMTNEKLGGRRDDVRWWNFENLRLNDPRADSEG